MGVHRIGLPHHMVRVAGRCFGKHQSAILGTQTSDLTSQTASCTLELSTRGMKVGNERNVKRKEARGNG